MKTKAAKAIRYKSVEDLGSALGLSELEMELIRQKKLLIELLKGARLKKGLSQAAVARSIGSKQPTIARMESGQVSYVSMDFLLKVALALECIVRFPAPGRPHRKAA